MKNIYFCAIICLILGTGTEIIAQCNDFYRKTPLGSDVKACTGGGYADWQVQLADAQSRTYAIEVLGSGSDNYNCHAYAWHKREGGDEVWINNLGNEINNVNKYWDDLSYLATTLTSGIDNLKVFFASDDHSAITTTDPNIFISKMGCGCLVRHYKNNSPYDASILRYYRKNKFIVETTNYVCNGQTFTATISPWSNYCTAAWINSSNLTLVSSSGNQATFRASSDTYSWIKATVTVNNKSTEIIKEIWVNSPPYSDFYYHVNKSSGEYMPPSGTSYYDVLCYNTTYHIKLECKQNIYLTNYQWTIPNGWTQYYTYNNMISINTNSIPGGQVSVTATTPCGATKNVYSAYFGPAPDCTMGMSSNSFFISPNPATDVVTVQLEEEVDENQTFSGQGANKTPPPGVIEIQLWSGMSLLRTYKTDQSVYQISVSDLPKGLYFVRVIKNGKTHTKKLIKN